LQRGNFGQGNFGQGNLQQGNFGQGNFGPGNFGQGNLGQGNFGPGNFGQGVLGQGIFNEVKTDGLKCDRCGNSNVKDGLECEKHHKVKKEFCFCVNLLLLLVLFEMFFREICSDSRKARNRGCIL
jgi:PPE-repeat protein